MRRRCRARRVSTTAMPWASVFTTSFRRDVRDREAHPGERLLRAAVDDGQGHLVGRGGRRVGVGLGVGLAGGGGEPEEPQPASPTPTTIRPRSAAARSA